jgi:glutaredoxin
MEEVLMEVKLYALSTCPYCRMTKKYLDGEGIEYDLVEVDLLEGDERDAMVAEVRSVSGGASFPVVVVGDEVIVGFNKKRMKELLSS